MKRVIARVFGAVFSGIVLIAPFAHAQAQVGKVTNLPIPRYVSLKSAKGNVRRGPSFNHRIDWVYQWRGMPLRITAEHGHWRRVEDRDGEGGWIHYSLLSGTRTVIVNDAEIVLFSRPMVNAMPVAQLKPDVVARLGECDKEWCYVIADDYSGWTPKLRLWGVDPEEVLE